MEALLVLLGLGLVGLFLATPILALLLATQAKARVKDLEERLDAREARVAELERRLARVETVEHRVAAHPSELPDALREAAAHPSGLTDASREAAAHPSELTDALREAAAHPSELTDALREAAAHPSGLTDASREAAAHPSGLTDASREAASAPAPASAPPTEPAPSLEEQLGLTWLTRIGAAAFLLGALFFFKYAVDNAWIGPTGRVVLGAVLGVVLLASAELLRPKTRPAFVHALSGIGLATLVASLWASVALYQLAPPVAAFVAVALVLALGAGLSLRHRAESLLVLVLVAGLANPVVLSTGQDRPAALFGYLLLLGFMALGVALRGGFRLVPALVVPGSAALFLGWYAKYFDIHGSAPAWSDVPPEARLGPYHSLTARLAPLVFVGLASAQWSAVALYLDRRTQRLLDAKLFALAALTLSHAGAAMLLHDHVWVLSVLAIGLGIAAIALLGALRATELLAVPMAAAFVVFLVVSQDVPADQRLGLVALFGGWTAVYVVGFVRKVLRQDPLPAGAAIAGSVAAGLFVVLAAVQLLPAKPAIFVVLVSIGSAAAAALALRARLGALHLAAVGFASLMIAIAAGVVREAVPALPLSPAFLGALVVFGLVHLVAVGVAALRAAEPVRWSSVLAGSLATLAFVAATLASTSDEVPTFRALITAAAGAADLALAAWIMRRRPEASVRLSVLAGLALGLFAAALAFGLEGATITVLWAALGCVAAAIAARSREWGWLVVASLLFFATFVRLVALDVWGTHALMERFLETQGREGVLSVPLLRSPRATGLAGTSLSLLVAAYLLAAGVKRAAAANDEARASLNLAAGIAAIGGHALWIALAVLEVRTAVTTLPAPPPVPLDAPEWAAFAARLTAMLESQQGRLAMTTTLVLSVAAAALLALGFAARSALHRYLGLALFFLAVAKLVVWDVWSVERIYQILLLTGVGALLVAGGFLYARFSDRLIALMRTGSSALVILLVASRVDAEELAPRLLPVGKYASMRAVTGIDAAGDHRLVVDEALYRASTSAELFADVRLVDEAGREVPRVVSEIPMHRLAPYVPGELLDPAWLQSGAAVATFRLPASTPHCRLLLDVTGETFLRRVRVETGDSRDALGVVAEGPYVYRIRHERGTVEHVEIPYPKSEARLVRVTLLPADAAEAGGRLSIAGGSFRCPSANDGANAFSEVPLGIEEIRRDEAERSTIVTLDAGAEGVPMQAITLDVGTTELRRRVDVTATSFREVWPAVGGGVLYRITPRPGVVLESMRLPIEETRKRYFRLLIHDEDSPPLVIRGARGEVRAREIVFRAATPGEHRLYVGDRTATAPYYDLAAILDRADRAEAPREAKMGPVLPNPRLGEAERAAPLPFTERHRAVLGAGLAVVLLALSFWAIRLLRNAAAADEGKPG
ncbi:DUF2339 domain-containing protein [Polyangium jinanense]|uniref:DUF2339 domain-containing protein n=1 Tax=Polyangium jinanense TaxID=2829994 RepID=UPI0023426550|nr:DUF2339 domain-containing protein [Polyangium jinanense]MDC3959584.1 DUF2339 domain-containing protein [Polyangium jinanense]